MTQNATKQYGTTVQDRGGTAAHDARMLDKCPTGIAGFDEITGGGLPQGRPTLVCGGAGCGKTLFSVEFLVRGATRFGEPGVFVSFEERADELVRNVASLGFDLNDLQERKLLAIDHVRVERSEIEETGEYDLEGLFIRLGYAIDSIGAKRVVLDTIESLFAGFSNQSILRAELRRLFGFLKDRGVSAVVTGERGDGQLTRQGLEEYVSDCVVLLDNRVANQVSTRRLRIVKYRGSAHGTNEYPFLIDEDGFTVLPITAAGLAHEVSDERVPTGVPALDQMLGGREGEGFYRGSSVLVSGTAGTGKSSLMAHFVRAACDRGERSLYFAFEESPSAIVRNMRTIGVDLTPHLESGLLRIIAARPTLHGLETHLATMQKHVLEFQPAAVVVDPITSLMEAGGGDDVERMVLRTVDMLKGRGITALFTSLTHGQDALEATEVGMSSLMDTWILLRDIEIGGERNRAIYVLKSRGMAHSNQVREFLITSGGIELVEAYLGPEGVLTGSARVAQEQRAREAEIERRQRTERERAALARRRSALAAQIEALRAEMEAAGLEMEAADESEQGRQHRAEEVRERIATSRRAARAANGRSHL